MTTFVDQKILNAKMINYFILKSISYFVQIEFIFILSQHVFVNKILIFMR